MKKMLYILNTTNKFNSFSYSAYLAAKEMGFEFHIAGNWTGYTSVAEKEKDEKNYGIKIHQIDFERIPFHPRNIKAYKQIVNLINRERYDIIHCNTPIGGVIGRLAGKKCGVDKIIYQVHGFHFYKGAPIVNWLLYYPTERLLAHYTDALITINREDYQIAKKLQLKKGNSVYYVPGVGIDTAQYSPQSEIKGRVRNSLHIPQNAIVVISVGELNKNKNNKLVIEAMNELDNPLLYYLICGKGSEEENLKKIVNSKHKERVRFLGYRTDIKELLQASDIFVLPSFREGLSRSLMEAMASGLACLASDIRGNRDLLQDKRQCLLDPHDITCWKTALKGYIDSPQKRHQDGLSNLRNVEEYSVENAKTKLNEAYREIV